MKESIILQEIGFTKAEADVYLALLETGSALAGKIIKKTGFHRSTTYQILERLKEKGYVSSVIQGKKQYFQGVSPDRILSEINDKKEKVELILPALKERGDFGKIRQDVTVYSGKKGIKTVLDKILHELGHKGEYFDFGVSGLFRNVMPDYWEKWQARKKKLGIKSCVIFDESIKKSSPDLLKNYFGRYRFYPKEYSSITDTIIYKDTVVLLIWTANPPIGIVIKNKDNELSYRNQFRMMWRRAFK